MCSFVVAVAASPSLGTFREEPDLSPPLTPGYRNSMALIRGVTDNLGLFDYGQVAARGVGAVYEQWSCRRFFPIQ
jgi:hypothetical protein